MDDGRADMAVREIMSCGASSSLARRASNRSARRTVAGPVINGGRALVPRDSPLRVLALAACVATLWAICSAPAWAQSVDTGVFGSVADESGGVLPGATVTVTNQATGVQNVVVTGASGTYEVRYLRRGEYLIDVSIEGFRPERRSFSLVGGQLIRLDYRLRIGDMTETVNVVAAGQLVETQSGVTGNVVTAETIANLPLSGRSFESLGDLTAGVVTSRSAVAGGTQFRAGGARGMYQQVSFDGVSALNNRGNLLFMYPTLDAVEEFKVQATNYTAEYGGHAGANVQLQLKSGTNRFSGTAFNYWSDDALNSRNYFAPAPNPKPQLERYQFGGVLGGPIRTNRTFFMVAYEGVRENRETVTQTNMLTEAMRRGDFSAVPTVITDPMTGLPFPGNIIPASRLDPIALSLLSQYQPLPNQSGSFNYKGVSGSKDTTNQFIARVDHVISNRQKVFAHYIYQNRDNPNTPVNPNFLVARLFQNHSAAAQHVTNWGSSLLNEVRFGYQRGNLNRLSPRRSSGFNVEEDLGIQNWLVGGPNGRPPSEDEIGFPAFSIQDFNGFGDSAAGEGVDKSQTYQFVDNVTRIRGQHALKMGVDVRRIMGDATSVNTPYGSQSFTRDITGNAAAAFMLGYPRTAQSPEGIPISGIRQWRTGLYVQDDWRITDRLTANLGLRYDHNTVPKDINGVSRTLRFDLDPKGPVLWPEPGEVVDQLYLNKHLRWSPRLGVAYRMTDKMVLRGGYGVFVMGIHLDNINTLASNPPTSSLLFTNPTRNPVATIGNPLPKELLPANPIFNITSAEVDRNHRDGYYQNWNVAMAYELTSKAAAEVRYVGSRGNNLESGLTNFNSPQPDPNASALDLQSRRPYPQFARIRMWVTDGISDYHSLQTEYKHRALWGLNFSVAYTLSQLKDNQHQGLNFGGERRQNPRSLEGEYANSIDDVRQTLVVGYVWDIPFGRNLTGLWGGLLKGWQFSGVGKINSGSPIYISQDGDTLNTDSGSAIRPNLVPGQNPILPSSERTADRWFNTAAFARATETYGNTPRNPVTGPGRNNLDTSLAKSFPVHGNQRVEFRWEVFNALNTVNWGAPNGTLGSPTFGRISSALPAREMQLSLKYLF